MTRQNPPHETQGPTAADVANWMMDELKKQGGILHQHEASSQIGRLFGEEFVYDNEESGNTCIRKEVLAAFRRVSGKDVVWSRGDRLWRRREAGDEPSRRQE